MENDREMRQSDNSRFVTVPGLCVLLFFALLAIYFKARIVGAFLSFFFLICLASRLWSMGVLSRVRFDAEPVISSCHEGDILKLKMKVRNFSFFPLVWLDVIIPTGTKELARSVDDDSVFHFTAEGTDIEQTGIRERFVWLLWQQEVAWEEDLRALRRGTCYISECRLMAGDGFGLSAQKKRCPLKDPFELVIYPRLYDVDVSPFLRSPVEAVARSRGSQEDVTILKGSRNYMPGDSAKLINWRILAKSGRMEVKLFETLMPGCATFIFDILSFHKMVKQEIESGTGSDQLVPEFQPLDFEIMISFIASCICSVTEYGISPALVIPSYRGHEAVVRFPGGTEDDETGCMDELARIDFEGRRNDAETQLINFPWEEFLELSYACGDIYICSMNESMAEYQELIDELGSGKVHRVFLRHTKAGGMENALCVEDLMPSAFAAQHLREDLQSTDVSGARGA